MKKAGVFRIVCAVAVWGWVTPGFSSDDFTDSMKCGSDYALVGDTKYDVLRKCGEPKLKDVVGTTGGGGYSSKGSRRSHKGKGAFTELVVEEWTYDRGSLDFVYTLVFEGNKLATVKRGSRGSKR